MSEQDASKVEWKLLPNGDHGIPPPGGNPNIAEEGHIMPLSSGAFYSVFRTTQVVTAHEILVQLKRSQLHDI
jgi:hypothetical protein